MTRSTKTRLGCESLEVRECPALLVGGDDYCGTRYPGPRPLSQVETRAIIAINPVTVTVPGPGFVPGPGVRGIIIEGG